MRRSYRVGMASGRSNLGEVYALDYPMTSRLQGAGLAVVRVEVEKSSGKVLVTWRSAPDDAAKAAAQELIGDCQHVS